MSIAPTCRPRNYCRNRGESDLERAGSGKLQTATALRHDHSSNRLVLAGNVVGSVNFGKKLLIAASSMPGSNTDFALAKFFP